MTIFRPDSPLDPDAPLAEQAAPTRVPTTESAPEDPGIVVAVELCPSETKGRTYRYDPAFHPAVEKGFLTAGQATQRGRRDVYASGLVRRHGLTLDIACLVADNRIPLTGALREGKRLLPDETVRPAAGRRRPWLRRLAAIGLIGAGAIALALLRPADPAPAEEFWQRVGRANVLVDGAGVPVQVVGPHPEAVLDAYCAASKPDRDLQPRGLMRQARKAAPLRVGIFEDRAGAEKLWAISIRKDSDTGAWTTGDGNSPIVVLAAPAHAARDYPRSE